MFPLPLGSPNRRLGQGRLDLYAQMLHQPGRNTHNNITLYLNFRTDTHKGQEFARDYFKNLSFATLEKNRLSFEEYLKRIQLSKFVLCPRGFGMDTHRHWETLVLGSYPVVLPSPLDPLFQSLPVLRVKTWVEVTEKLLRDTFALFQSQKFKKEKLFLKYWLDQIDAMKTTFVA